jgi:hypothetical protein
VSSRRWGVRSQTTALRRQLPWVDGRRDSYGLTIASGNGPPFAISVAAGSGACIGAELNQGRRALWNRLLVAQQAADGDKGNDMVVWPAAACHHPLGTSSPGPARGMSQGGRYL